MCVRETERKRETGFVSLSCLTLSSFFVSLSVHNWTQDDVVRWLKDFVELPQYERNFKDFKVNGNTLPR